MNNIHMGQLIVQLRLQNDMSQKALAEALNISPSTLCKWESGRSTPDFDSLSRISDIFQISGDDLLRPEATLQRMREDGCREEPGEVPNKDKKKTLLKKKRIFAVSGALTVILFSVGVYLVSQILRPKFEMIEIRYKQETEQGVCYEISVFCSGYLKGENYTDYVDMIHAGWKDLELPENTDTIELRFYQNREMAVNWDWPDKIYIIVL